MVKTVKKKQKFTKSNFRVESYEPTRDFVDSSPTEEHYGVAYDVDDLPKIAMVHTLDRPVQPTSKRSTVIEIYPGGIFQPGVVVSSNATSSFDIGMSGDGVTAQSQDLFQEQEPNDCEDNFGELDRNNEGGKFLPSHNAMNMSRIKSRKNLRIQMKKAFLTSDLQSMRKASAKYVDSTAYSTSYKTNRLTRPKDCHRRKSWSYVYQRNTFAKDRNGDEMSKKKIGIYILMTNINQKNLPLEMDSRLRRRLTTIQCRILNLATLTLVTISKMKISHLIFKTQTIFR